MELQLTPEELAWIRGESGKEPTSNESSSKGFDKEHSKRVKLSDVHLGETVLPCVSTVRGKVLVAGDVLTFKSHKTKKGSVIRVYKVDGSEIGKLTTGFANTIQPFLEWDIASFKAHVILAPQFLNPMDEILVSVQVSLKQRAFNRDFEASMLNNLEPDVRIFDRKKAINAMFKRLGFPDFSTVTIDSIVSTNEELSARDLDQVYKKANSFDKSLTPMETPPDMLLKLREYQGRALKWLYSKENQTGIDTTGLSPLWRELNSKDGPFYYNLYSGELSLSFPKETHTQGGILADEMGLGKTIEMVAALYATPFTSKHEMIKTLVPKSHSTLIVCPLNLIAQWRDEIKKCFGGKLTSTLFHGDRQTYYLAYKDRDGPDVVITTYGTLSSEFLSHSKSKTVSPLFSVHWHRIVLDEAHYIKDRNSLNAKAVYKLNGSFRWAVTGTPIINKLEVEPWCQYSYWHSFITLPFEKRNPVALDVVQTIMEPLILRRTKDMQDENGVPIVDLPLKTITLKTLTFSPQEREIYSSLAKYSQRKLYELKIVGKADYMHVFQLLCRLRQCCDHPSLLRSQTDDLNVLEWKDLVASYCKNPETSNEFADSLLQDLKTGRECLICFEMFTGGIVMPCLHVVCRPCIEDMLQTKQAKGEDMCCPVCRQVCTEEELLQVMNSECESNEPVTLRSMAFTPSTKLSALIADLSRIRDEFPGEKAVVFSQWTSMLDLVQVSLKEHAFQFVRIDGSLSQPKREKVFKTFAEDASVTLLIASLRSTGVGLNLTSASHCFLLDPWWNVSTENQAIDRVHRLGQTRPVFVTRYIIQDSVEEKMLAIQFRKDQLVGAVTNADSKIQLDDLMALFH